MFALGSTLDYGKCKRVTYVSVSVTYVSEIETIYKYFLLIFKCYNNHYIQ